MSEEKKVYKVLIIDDAFFIRNLIKRAILTKPEDENLGYSFDVIGEAINGKDGIVEYFKLQPDLITLDINMPDINGIEVAKHILSKDANAKIIAISGNLDESIKQEILNAGALAYVQKPFQNASLWEKLDSFVDIIEGDSKIIEEPINEETLIDLVQEEQIIELVQEIEEVELVQDKNIELIGVVNDEQALTITQIESTTIDEVNKDIVSHATEEKDLKPVNIGDEKEKNKVIEELPIKKQEVPIILKSDDNDEDDDLLSSNKKIVSNKSNFKKVENKQNNKINTESSNLTNQEKLLSPNIEKGEDTFNFSVGMSFDINKELPKKLEQPINTENVELTIDEANESVVLTTDEETILVQCNDKIEDNRSNKDDIDTNIVKDVQSHTTINQVHTYNCGETDTSSQIEIISDDNNEFIVLGGDNSADVDIEIDIKSEENPDDVLIIIEETSTHNSKPEPIQPKSESVNLLKNESQPTYNNEKHLDKGQAVEMELNNDRPIYNTEDNKVHSYKIDENKNHNSIAPPRSKALKEMYADKIHNEYQTTYGDEFDEQPVKAVKKKKDGLFTSIKKLFNKK